MSTLRSYRLLVSQRPGAGEAHRMWVACQTFGICHIDCWPIPLSTPQQLLFCIERGGRLLLR